MKSGLFFCLLLMTVFAGLTSCGQSDIDLSKRPSDYQMDYWLGDTMRNDELNDFLLYAPKYELVDTYLDSDYSFEMKADIKTLPSHYVIYDVYTENQISVIQTIHITDPEVSLYGLSLKSSASTIKRKLSNMGFEYFDQYSGWYPSYSNDPYLFTFTNDTIILSIVKS